MPRQACFGRIFSATNINSSKRNLSNTTAVTFRGYLAKILSFKSGNLLYKSNFYLLSEGTVVWGVKFLVLPQHF